MTTLYSLAQLETMTKTYADARGKLASLVTGLNDEVTRVRRAKMKGIKAAVEASANAKNALRAAVGDSAGLFVKPRTVIFHGVKVGFQKGKGKLDWDDDAQVIKLIRKHLPGEADVLIKTEESVIKGALKNLEVADLKRIGVTVEETGDYVVVKATDTEIDKMVDALLKAATDEPEAAAAD